MLIDIDKILDEARVLGCSDLHFTFGMAPVVRLNGNLRKLSSYDYEKIEELLKNHTEDEVIFAYKNYGDKPLNYIAKVLKNKKKVPEWLNKEIENEKLNQESLDVAKDFKDFIEEFRK